MGWFQPRRRGALPLRTVVMLLILVLGSGLIPALGTGAADYSSGLGCGSEKWSAVFARMLPQLSFSAPDVNEVATGDFLGTYHPLATEGVAIRIDTTRRRLALLSSGIVIKEYPVAVGKSSTPTPLGYWVIKEKGIWAEGFGARWMGLNIPWGVYGIHGTNKPWSIGGRESGGCIRMFNRDVIELFRYVQVGTPVIIVGKPFYRFGEIRRIIRPTHLGTDVVNLQTKLKRMGFYNGEIDGKFGRRTRYAVEELQKAMKLPAVGYVGPETYDIVGLRALAEDPNIVR